jgi:RNA recognition motif-containing protein
MNIYVGNLSFETDDAALRTAFEPHGQVTSAQVIMDRDTGRSRGFGFVEMASPEEAKAAIAALNGTDLNGRSLNVNEARPRGERRSGGGGGGSGGGDRGGRGGDRGGRRPSW